MGSVQQGLTLSEPLALYGQKPGALLLTEHDGALQILGKTKRQNRHTSLILDVLLFVVSMLKVTLDALYRAC